jgi:hypothetical protein
MSSLELARPTYNMDGQEHIFGDYISRGLAPENGVPIAYFSSRKLS